MNSQPVEGVLSTISESTHTWPQICTRVEWTGTSKRGSVARFMTLALPLAILCIGYVVIIALSAYLIYNWMVVPDSKRGPRFRMLQRLNILVIALACLAALAVITGYYLSGRITFVGLPIVILLFLSAGQPKRFENR